MPAAYMILPGNELFYDTGNYVKPVATLSEQDRAHLTTALGTVQVSPYKDYLAFREQVAAVAAEHGIPESFREACGLIQEQRAEGSIEAHVMRNCPVDDEIPALGHDDPSSDKRATKITFVAESFLELFAQQTATPLLAYAGRFGGDFFTDVIAINRYRGKQTGYSDGEVVYHNDRTAHPVRGDYITLLGMRCPAQERIYTGFVGIRELLSQLSPLTQDQLRKPHFVTPLDVVSRDADTGIDLAPVHSILANDGSIRYLDTHTTTAPGTPVTSLEALLALKDALVRAPKARHQLLGGDLLTFANQRGLHNREHIEIIDPEQAFDRWLLKTYAFRDQVTADSYSHEWVDGLPGKVNG